MTVTASVYGLATQSLTAKTMNLASDTLKVMLCTSSYTPNQATHQYQSDITNEVTGSGYTAGGAGLTSVVAAYTSGTKTWNLSAANVSWTIASGTTIAARYAIVYDSQPGTAGTNPLICYVNFGGDITASGSTFTITWDAAGIISITVT